MKVLDAASGDRGDAADPLVAVVGRSAQGERHAQFGLVALDEPAQRADDENARLFGYVVDERPFGTRLSGDGYTCRI